MVKVRTESGRLFDLPEPSGAPGGDRGWCGQCSVALREWTAQDGERHRGCALCGLLLIKPVGLVWQVQNQGLHLRCGSQMVGVDDWKSLFSRRCSRCKKGYMDLYGGE